MFTHVESFKSAFLEKLETMYGKSFKDSTTRDQYNTLGYMVREYMNSQWIATNESYRSGERKQMYYLSIEFLLGRLLGSNILNLGIRDVCEQGLSELGISLQQLEEVEADAGLGNGGLGRLAACFLDSLASLNLRVMAVEFVTNTAYLTKRLWMVIKLSFQNSGFFMKTYGK